MQKKIRSTKALLLVTLMVVTMLLAGCKKSYASLEEYVKSNPEYLTALDASLTNSDMTGKSEVSGNVIVMKLYYKQTVWGQSDSADSQMKSFLDKYFDSSSSQWDEFRKVFAEESGIDVSKISFRIESYNPDASSPAYTYSYPKN